jgi:hypothetical protein
MSIATKTSPLPLEAHDAPRATPPARPEVTAGEPSQGMTDPLDVELDNPYDNIACTD